MMKKIVATIGIVIALTACSGNWPAVDNGELSESERGNLFISLVREESEGKPLNWVDTWTDTQLVELAHATCRSWDSGLTFEEIVIESMSVLIEDGWDSVTDLEMLGTVIGAGTPAFCPEHNGMIE